METHTKFKLERNALRWFVFLLGIGLCAYTGLLCLGMRHIVAEIICLTFAYVLLAINVWAFRLCWLAWTFLTYSYAVRLCMVLYDIGFFGEYLHVAHIIAFSIGLILILLLITKFKNCVNEKPEADSQDAA